MNSIREKSQHPPKVISSRKAISHDKAATIVRVTNPVRVATSSVKVAISPVKVVTNSVKVATSPVTSSVSNSHKLRANRPRMPRAMP